MLIMCHDYLQLHERSELLPLGTGGTRSSHLARVWREVTLATSGATHVWRGHEGKRQQKFRISFVYIFWSRMTSIEYSTATFSSETIKDAYVFFFIFFYFGKLAYTVMQH